MFCCGSKGAAMKKRIYISGKMSGDPDYVQKFLNAEYQLTKAEYKTMNPTRFISSSANWNRAMRVAIYLMMKCDGVALLPDWKQSKGAKIEERLARDIGMPVMPLDKWLNSNIAE